MQPLVHGSAAHCRDEVLHVLLQDEECVRSRGQHTVDDRRPIKRADRIKSDKIERRAEQRRHRDRCIEGAGIVGFGVKALSAQPNTSLTAQAADPASTGTASRPVPMIPNANSANANSPTIGRSASAAKPKEPPAMSGPRG